MTTSTKSTGITYHPELTKEFIEDHKQLLILFGKMNSYINVGDIINFKIELKAFKAALTAHLLMEAVKLYIYLKQNLKNDEAVYDLVVSYKREMDTIGRVVMKFLDEYTLKPNDEFDLIELRQQLSTIGATLVDRIEREESQLYPLYHDAYL
jgi:regulator of sigma D